MLQLNRSRIAWAAVLPLCAAALVVHAYGFTHYGYFRDELYYLACSRHLDWGYVDQPPLIAAIAWFTRVVLGGSLPALRIVAALADAAEVAIAALIARELGGRAFAQSLAAASTLFAPGVLAMDGFLSMNAFEPLFWLGSAWLAARMVNSREPRLWLWTGLLTGLGLQNKYSMLLFAGSLVLGLLLTPERRLLRSPWFWAAAAIACAIFLPNLIWNVRHEFPFLELQGNIRRSGRDVALSAVSFFGEEVLLMNPWSLPLWLAGLWFYFFSSAGKRFRALGWAWVFTALAIVALSPRVYYLFPAFPLLFAAGAAAVESSLSPAFLPRWRYLAPASLAMTGAILAPLAIPLMPPEAWLDYTKRLGVGQPAIENHRLGPLPQVFADEFGWEEMTAAVARVYNQLPPDVRPRTAIFTQNYGEGGAIDLFGPRYGLPPAIGGHQSYFLWGPRGYTGESVIVVAGDPRDLERRFTGVRRAAAFSHPYSMPYEHFDIYYCTGLRGTLAGIWPEVKKWD